MSPYQETCLYIEGHLIFWLRDISKLGDSLHIGDFPVLAVAKTGLQGWSQNSQENSCAKVSFLIIFKKETLTQVFSIWIFFFEKFLRTLAASE